MVLCTYSGLCSYILSHPSFTDVMAYIGAPTTYILSHPVTDGMGCDAILYNSAIPINLVPFPTWFLAENAGTGLASALLRYI